MQAKWEQISVSTLVLYLCEILIFDAPVWDGDLQVCWLLDPSAVTDLPFTHNNSYLHSYYLYAHSEMAVLRVESGPVLKPLGRKKHF